MTHALTIEAVKKLYPCSKDYRRVSKLLPKRRKIDAVKARELGCTYDDILWVASAIAENDDDVKSRLTHFFNDNAKAVLHIFERAAPNDGRVRDYIQATDDFLAGKTGEDNWLEAAKAAWAAWDAKAARDAWAAWDAKDVFHEWQFDRLVYWLAEESPEPLPMPNKGVSALPEIEALTKVAA